MEQKTKIYGLLPAVLPIIIFSLLSFMTPKTATSQTVTLYISTANFNPTNPESWETSRNLESDLVYVGEVRNGFPNGGGTYTWPDGRKYIGSFKDDKRNGQGTYTWPNGAKYVGEY